MAIESSFCTISPPGKDKAEKEHAEPEGAGIEVGATEQETMAKKYENRKRHEKE